MNNTVWLCNMQCGSPDGQLSLPTFRRTTEEHPVHALYHQHDNYQLLRTVLMFVLLYSC